jgi:ethanolamine utilization protein EutQ
MLRASDGCPDATQVPGVRHYRPRKRISPCAPQSRVDTIRPMPTLIAKPTRIESAGNKPKIIEEYIGRVNSSTNTVSIAHMRSPEGWQEPAQTPEFDEYTVVLRGTLRVQHKSGEIDVTVGQAVIAHRGEWVRYSTPLPGGAEYIAVCLPAFSLEAVQRES